MEPWGTSFDRGVHGTPVEYPSRESKHDIKESEDNLFNTIFRDNGHRQGPPGWWIYVGGQQADDTGKTSFAIENDGGHTEQKALYIGNKRPGFM